MRLGGKVETVFQENVPESADAERVMTKMAPAGADMIFATSFGYMDPVINVAKKFPKVNLSTLLGIRQQIKSLYIARGFMKVDL